MDETPRQFIEELKSAILRRRIGQIALAVVLAEECIRFLNSLIWYLIIPVISNALAGHTESVLFASKRDFPWIQLVGAFLEFATALTFVFYVNRWIHGRNKLSPGKGQSTLRQESPEPFEAEDEPLVPHLLSAPYPSHHEPVPSTTEPGLHSEK